MNWLERARREMRASGPGRTANTAERNPTAVTAVRADASSGESPQALHDAWEERAAIMEFDGGLSREEAERCASDLVYARHRLN